MTSSQAETTLKQNGQAHKSPLIKKTQVTLNPGELLLYESARLPHGRTSFLRFASFHLLQLDYQVVASFHLLQHDYQVKPLIWPAVSVSICGLGLLVTLFLCHLFVEPKEKTGLKPYYDRYLFLSEGRASPIYLCIIPKCALSGFFHS